MRDQPKPSRICSGQKITEGKYDAAKALREDMTPAETRLWDRLRANRLKGYHFRRQQIIEGFIADFYCHGAALAVEIDGNGHNKAYDFERDRVFEGKGILTLRFSNQQALYQTDDVLEEILVQLEERS